MGSTAHKLMDWHVQTDTVMMRSHRFISGDISCSLCMGLALVFRPFPLFLYSILSDLWYSCEDAQVNSWMEVDRVPRNFPIRMSVWRDMVLANTPQNNLPVHASHAYHDSPIIKPSYLLWWWWWWGCVDAGSTRGIYRLFLVNACTWTAMNGYGLHFYRMPFRFLEVILLSIEEYRVLDAVLVKCYFWS